MVRARHAAEGDDACTPISTHDVTMDLTERMRVERERDHLAAIVASSDDAIYSRTLEGVITSWNPGAERLYGCAADEIIGQPNRLLIPPERADEMPEAVNVRLLRGDRIEPFETVRVHKDGRLIDVSISLSAVQDATGRLVGVSIIARDISERRALERTQQEFLAIISHELRNPLGTVKGYAQLLQRRREYNERAVEAIVSQANQLARLVGDLIDASSIGFGRLDLQRAGFDIVTETRACVEQAQAQTDRHALRFEAPDGPLVVWADRARLAQVFLNLLTNASKYSPDGGEVLVGIEDRGSDVEISVADHGIGIAPEALSRLFDRFYRADARTRSWAVHHPRHRRSPRGPSRCPVGARSRHHLHPDRAARATG